MKLNGRYATKAGCISIFILALFMAGCGGGGSSSSSDSSSASGALSVQAVAGDIIGIRVGDIAHLDGSASTTSSSDALQYTWSFTHKPQASTATLINPNSSNPTFKPDVVGTYMVQLTVTSGGLTSKRAIALVEASISGNVTGNVRVHTSFPSKCSNCHDGRYLDPKINPGFILPKSGSHVGTTNVCEACHTTFGFKLVNYVDHNEVFGKCSTCHDGVKAVGKSPSHVATTSECDSCHNTTSFLNLDANGKYDHTGISSGCATCHNGKTAIGTNHNPDTFAKSNNDCVFCHNTTSFKGAYPDHSVILADVTAGTAKCTDCHGSTAQGPKSGHPNIAPADCVACHSVKKFSLGGVFNHRVDASVVACQACHTEPNSINAIGTASFPANVAPGVHGATNGNDCGVCHGTSVVRSFKNTVIDHSAANVVAQRCDSCHDGAGTALHKTPNHITTQTTPTVVDCNACHTPGNFATGTFDHSVNNMVGLTCSGCHNGTNSVGKVGNHIPTTLECDSCHTADTPATPSTFAGTQYHPNNNPTSCSSCHDGVIQKGKNRTHLATTRDCSNCHTTVTPLTFKGGTYDHSDPGVSTNCASCHDGIRAIDKTNKGTKLNHIPAKNECSECHNNTAVPGGFTSNMFLANVHPNNINGCAGCHTAKYLSARPALLKTGSVKHLPTSQDCHSCHSNVNFADKTKFTHDGITGNCASCHDGSYYASSGAKGKSNPVPAKTHPVTTTDCGSCHGIGNGFLDGGFDHTGTIDNCASCHGDNAPAPPTGAVTRKSSFPSHVVTTQDCSICHIPGTFKTAVFNHNQIVKDCVSCHENPGATATVKPNPGHVATTKDCYECHNKDKFAGAKYDHTGITSNCASCHDGIIALGKNGTHVPTGDDCSVCHQTTGMKPATFDHAGIITNCVSCHDGSLATGKKAGHVATNLDCGSCHSVPKKVIVANGPTNSWIPASHVAVSNNTRCDSCHGVTATGKDAKTNPNHWLTSLDCRDCHTTAGFKPAGWKHEASSKGTCNTCHSPSGGARDKTTAPGGHMTTTSQCDECHTTTAWAPTNFSHDPNKITQDDYPGDHNAAFGCVACHGNSIDNPFVYPTAKYAPFCAACHAKDFESEGKHNGGKNGTVDQNKDCSGGGAGCHKVGDRKFG